MSSLLSEAPIIPLISVLAKATFSECRSITRIPFGIMFSVSLKFYSNYRYDPSKTEQYPYQTLLCEHLLDVFLVYLPGHILERDHPKDIPQHTHLDRPIVSDIPEEVVGPYDLPMKGFLSWGLTHRHVVVLVNTNEQK
jgi:hypothetical protein